MIRIGKGLLLMALLVCLSLLGWIPEGSTAPKVMNLFIGSTSSSSSAYPIVVATARMINRNVPEVRVTLLETGATHDNIQRMMKGKIQICGSTGFDGPIMAYNGLYQYKDKPFKAIRVFFHERATILLFAVRVDSGVKTLRDLNGKRFHVGIPGGAAELNPRRLCEAFGIKPEFVYGSLADGIEMVKEGRAMGLSKYSPGVRTLDASIMDIKSNNPMRLLSLTEEEIEKALQIIPGHIRIELTADNPLLKTLGQESLVSIVMPGSHYISAELPADLVYKMIRGIVKDWKTDMVPAFAETADLDVIKNTIQTASGVPNPLPLHAGVVKYFIERGYDVPSKVLPPEWKK